jgi:hypothetical protein
LLLKIDDLVSKVITGVDDGFLQLGVVNLPGYCRVGGGGGGGQGRIIGPGGGDQQSQQPTQGGYV